MIIIEVRGLDSDYWSSWPTSVAPRFRARKIELRRTPLSGCPAAGVGHRLSGSLENSGENSSDHQIILELHRPGSKSSKNVTILVVGGSAGAIPSQTGKATVIRSDRDGRRSDQINFRRSLVDTGGRSGFEMTLPPRPTVSYHVAFRHMMS